MEISRPNPPSHYLLEAYYLARELEALPDASFRLQGQAEQTLLAAETAALLSRQTYGRLCKSEKRSTMLLPPSSLHIIGHVERLSQGWLQIRLNTLLSSSRRSPTGYIEDTLHRLLHAYITDGGTLPWFRRAVVSITEHSALRRGNVYDADNKDWKCITNSLKGMLFEDDDQFTVSLHLDAVWEDAAYCLITVMPREALADYLTFSGEFGDSAR